VSAAASASTFLLSLSLCHNTASTYNARRVQISRDSLFNAQRQSVVVAAVQ